MSANCIRAEHAMRVDSIAGPPFTSAETLMAMNAVAAATLSVYPEPNLQICIVWKIVPRPHTASAVKSIHDR